MLKQGINHNCDRLTHIANNDVLIRQMPGCRNFVRETHYKRNTVGRNLKLMTPELLSRVNRVIVAEATSWRAATRMIP